MRIAASALELIGNTPLVELSAIEEDNRLAARVVAKLEAFNPGGSAKDRVAYQMIDDAERDGRLTRGSTIIEPTSGNTGIGLAMVAGLKGYKSIIVMPENMSEERRKTIAAYGAILVLTPAAEGMSGAIRKAEELHVATPGSIVAGQFSNPSNPKAHYSGTGPEIWRDTDGKVDIFIAGVGTGGTITGAGRFLKQQNPNIKVVAVEPLSSAVLSGQKPGRHGLQGIGAGFIPEVLDTSIYDEIIKVTDDDAYVTGRALAEKEGLLVGITSGAAAWAALQVAKRPENKGKLIVVLLPDTGARYLSTPLFR